MALYTATGVRIAPVSIEIKISELRTELFRKAIHILIAAVPFLAAFNILVTLILLAAGTLFYTVAEYFRSRGHELFLISRITILASRDREQGRFVLGPITLGVGAMLALLLYPDPSATIAIFALAFGDSISSLIGKFYGSRIIPHTGGKTYAGSTACFFVVLLIAYRVTGALGFSVIIGVAATVLEALPTRDLDNILIPVGTGFIASQLIHLAV